MIVYDPDVDAAAVGLGRREAQKIVATNDGDAVALILTLVTQGRKVSWLGTGNPLVGQRWSNRANVLGAVAPFKVEGLGHGRDDEVRATGPDA